MRVRRAWGIRRGGCGWLRAWRGGVWLGGVAVVGVAGGVVGGAAGGVVRVRWAVLWGVAGWGCDHLVIWRALSWRVSRVLRVAGVRRAVSRGVAG